MALFRPDGPNAEVSAARDIANPKFKDFTQINEHLAFRESSKEKVRLGQPVAAGFAVLELSKLRMYDMYYNVIKPKWGENVTFAYMDTDSLILKIKSPTYHKDLLDLRHEFDFSNYPRDHPLFEGMSENEYKDTILSNKGVLGKFKDELEGREGYELIALKPKLYSILAEDAKDTKAKSKGIPQVVAKKFKHENFKKCLEASQSTVLEGKHGEHPREGTIQMTEPFLQFESDKHKIYTVKKTKIALTGYEDKKYWLDAYTSLPHGHYKTK
jgi:hypothetical protein